MSDVSNAMPFPFEEFYVEQRQRLTRYVATRVPVDDVDEVVADAFCRMFEYCRTADREIAHPRALLLRITRSSIADYYEKGGKKHEVPLEEAPPVVAPIALDAESDARRDLALVTSALAAIHEEYREVITLHANVGLTIAEIAEMIGKRPATVRVLIFRARRALERELRTRGAFEESGAVPSTPPPETPAAPPGTTTSPPSHAEVT